MTELEQRLLDEVEQCEKERETYEQNMRLLQESYEANMQQLRITYEQNMQKIKEIYEKREKLYIDKLKQLCERSEHNNIEDDDILKQLNILAGGLSILDKKLQNLEAKLQNLEAKL